MMHPFGWFFGSVIGIIGFIVSLAIYLAIIYLTLVSSI